MVRTLNKMTATATPNARPVRVHAAVAAALLRRRKLAQTANDLDAVFVTRNGTWHYPTNSQGRLRHIRLLDVYADLTVLQGVTPHSFRRTVATEIDEVYDAEAAGQRPSVSLQAPGQAPRLRQPSSPDCCPTQGACQVPFQSRAAGTHPANSRRPVGSTSARALSATV